MECSRVLSIPVFSVFLLMGFVYYITVFVFIEDWVGLQSSAGTLNALIFTFMASLCLFSFVVSVLTDPGYAPLSFIPDIERDEEALQNSLQWKQCDKCCAFKPPRAHHCKVCKTCVLRMDHHCLWINNCVGYWNYKAFFILVFYATIASIYSVVMIICASFHKDWDFNKRIHLKIFYIISGVIMIALSISLGSLFGWHICLIAHNMTTIEHYEGKRAAWLAKKSGQSYRNPFDLGVYKNITSVLGSNMLKWLCPTSVDHLKDGITFPSSHNS